MAQRGGGRQVVPSSRGHNSRGVMNRRVTRTAGTQGGVNDARRDGCELGSGARPQACLQRHDAACELHGADIGLDLLPLSSGRQAFQQLRLVADDGYALGVGKRSCQRSVVEERRRGRLLHDDSVAAADWSGRARDNASGTQRGSVQKLSMCDTPKRVLQSRSRT